MKSIEIPQGPWYNPSISAGVYDAEIVRLTRGKYGLDNDLYLQIALWLPQVDRHIVTNLYFPKGQPEAHTVKRLARLCQVVGLVPQNALDRPQDFNGCQLQVKVGIFSKGNRDYCDVELFLHADSVTA